MLLQDLRTKCRHITRLVFLQINDLMWFHHELIWSVASVASSGSAPLNPDTVMPVSRRQLETWCLQVVCPGLRITTPQWRLERETFTWRMNFSDFGSKRRSGQGHCNFKAHRLWGLQPVYWGFRCRQWESGPRLSRCLQSDSFLLSHKFDVSPRNTNTDSSCSCCRSRGHVGWFVLRAISIRMQND